MQQEKIIIEFKHSKLECNICRNEFKKKNTLKSHVEKFCIVKWLFGSGSSSYKCDNCSKKFTEKCSIENHVEKDRMKFLNCLQVFPTINSLNIHINAAHDKVIIRHNIEREPSLKLRKIQRTT